MNLKTAIETIQNYPIERRQKKQWEINEQIISEPQDNFKQPNIPERGVSEGEWEKAGKQKK